MIWEERGELSPEQEGVLPPEVSGSGARWRGARMDVHMCVHACECVCTGILQGGQALA